MNKVLGFIKGNLIVVISVLLILTLLPVGYFFSNKWNGSVRAKVEEAYKREKNALTSSGRVTYALPAVLEGESDLSETRAPNSAVTAFYKEQLETRKAQVEEVIARGREFNQGDHEELVPGLLPDAGEARERQRLGRVMNEAIVGTSDSPSVYQRKLRRLNAGAPPSPQVLAQVLEQTKAQYEQDYRSANTQGTITPEQEEEIRQKLIARRLAEYMARAKSLTFYCSPEAFVNESPQSGASTIGPDGFSVVPATLWPPSRIDETVAFTWLWDYWVISDILDAVAYANTNAASGAMSVIDAPVKSVESIRVSALRLDDEDSASGRGSYGRGGAAAGSSDAFASAAEFTGREGGTPNSPYDIRYAHVVAVVASKDLPKFLDAFSKVNFMTVTDVDLQEVDVWEDLQQGYYYGNDHVVRVAITVETVWLRSWVAPLMPQRVREALGVPATVADAEG